MESWSQLCKAISLKLLFSVIAIISIGLLILGQVCTDGSLVNTFQQWFYSVCIPYETLTFFPGASLKCCAKKSVNKQHGLCHLVHILVMFVPLCYDQLFECLTLPGLWVSQEAVSSLYTQYFKKGLASGRRSINVWYE